MAFHLLFTFNLSHQNSHESEKLENLRLFKNIWFDDKIGEIFESKLFSL